MINKFMTAVADFSTGRLALLGALLAGIYYVVLFNDGASIRQNIATLTTQIEEEKNKKVDTTRILQKEEQMRANVAMLVKKYEEVKSKIPIEFLESELRILIDQLVTQCDLKTTRNQRSTKNKDFGTSQDSKLVDQVVLEYTFSGTYYNLEKFISLVSSFDKLIQLENFELVVENKKTPSGSNHEVSLAATVIGFKQSSVALNENKSEIKK